MISTNWCVADGLFKEGRDSLLSAEGPRFSTGRLQLRVASTISRRKRVALWKELCFPSLLLLLVTVERLLRVSKTIAHLQTSPYAYHKNHKNIIPIHRFIVLFPLLTPSTPLMSSFASISALADPPELPFRRVLGWLWVDVVDIVTWLIHFKSASALDAELAIKAHRAHFMHFTDDEWHEFRADAETQGHTRETFEHAVLCGPGNHLPVASLPREFHTKADEPRYWVGMGGPLLCAELLNRYIDGALEDARGVTMVDEVDGPRSYVQVYY